MPGKIKVNFKMPPETAAEKLYRKHQELRKKSGLPDPEHYKKIAAQKQKEIDDLRKEATEQLDEMPESSMKTRDVHAHLKKAGWSLKRTGGGHDVYAHPKSKEHIAVPRHKQLKAPLIRGIMKASRVSEEAELDEQLYKKGKFVSGPVKKPYKSPTIATPVREAKDEVELSEGRPSQRHPLEGHEYHKKTDAELEHIGKDAHKAAEAMKDHNTTAENKYRDQANDAATVRYFRKKSGMPDWYKKKYGHVKEEVEYLEEKNEPTNPALWSKAKSLAKQKFDVYPSAYANGWAAKWYKSKGGGWRSVSESVNEAADDNAKPVLSRKAQIVKDAAKKKDSPEKFQKDPELSSDIHKT